MFKNKAKRKYTKKHRKAFKIVESLLTGRNTMQGRFHDIDKMILYCFFDYKTVHEFHRKHSKHHEKAKTFDDYLLMVIDWECARFTKPDKGLNAYDTLYAYYPELESRILPILESFNLAKSGSNWLDQYKDYIEERLAA